MPQNFIQDVLCIFLFFTFCLNFISISLFIVCWFSRSNMTSTCDTNREAHTTQINFNSSHQATVTL